MVSVSKSRTLIRVAVIDFILLAAICLVPALSHLAAFPFYKLNPMLLCLLLSMALVNNRYNSLLMAVLLPFVSMLICGMPTFERMVCMVAELSTIVALYGVVYKGKNRMLSLFTSIVAGKIVYYLLKYAIVSPSLLVTTNWVVQLLVVIAYVLFFEFIVRVTTKSAMHK